VGDAIEAALAPLLKLVPEALLAKRRDKFLEMGREAVA
jgi:hypothetical protein